MTHYNSNGLVNGLIPAGEPCPFAAKCGLIMDRCPVEGKVKSHAFSCAAARGFSLCMLHPNEMLYKIIAKP